MSGYARLVLSTSLSVLWSNNLDAHCFKVVGSPSVPTSVAVSTACTESIPCPEFVHKLQRGRFMPVFKVLAVIVIAQ